VRKIHYSFVKKIRLIRVQDKRTKVTAGKDVNMQRIDMAVSDVSNEETANGPTRAVEKWEYVGR
jgi:hypothetical protein